MAAEPAALRVLMTADTLGGVWNHALELAAALGALGVSVTIASMGARPTPLQREQAARLPSAALRESAWRLEWMDDPWDEVRAAGDWLLELEQALRPDIVHLNQFAFGALPFAAPKLVVAHSCVLSWWRSVRGGCAPAAFDAYRRVVAGGLAGADLVAAPTRSMLSSLAGNYGFEGPAVVLPNGRGAKAFAPCEKQPFIFTAGRLWDEAKNLAALEAVAPRLPWPVCVAGSSAHPDGGLRQPRNVCALGELPPEALAAQFARAAIYALPARYEPFGQTALEAALSGCALVLGDIESLREVWGESALYVPPDDHGALQATLLRLIGEPALRVQLGRRALARAKRFAPERMAEAYLRSYRRLLARGHGPVETAAAMEAACAS